MFPYYNQNFLKCIKCWEGFASRKPVRTATAKINGYRERVNRFLSWTTGLLQMWGFCSVSRDIKHKRWIRDALIAKYNKCAGICLGDAVTQWRLHIPSSLLSLTFPAVSQAGCRALCFWSSGLFFLPPPSGLHFPLSAFIWLCLREILVFGPVWLPACLPLFYSYTVCSDWRLSVNMKSLWLQLLRSVAERKIHFRSVWPVTHAVSAICQVVNIRNVMTKSKVMLL